MKTAVGVALILLSVSMVFIIPFLPMSSDKQVEASFLDNIKTPYVLLFFGYPGCGQTCPISMKVLTRVYNAYDKIYEEHALGVIFVNLDIRIFSQESDAYAKGYHKNFIGFHPSPDQFETLRNTFGLLFDISDKTGDIDHQGYTYLLAKQGKAWKIKYTYMRLPLNAEELLDDLKSLRENKNFRFFRGLF